MIKRLRIKFICINMTIVTIMLCVIFGLVLHFTGVNLERRSMEMMQTVALEPMRLGVPGKRTPGIHLPYFALQTGPGGELLASDSGHYDLTDHAMLEELLLLSSDNTSGELPDYGLRYIRVVTPTTQCIVFADMSSEMNTMDNLLENCLIIGAVSFLAFLIISILLANWAVKPVSVAWDQQRQFVTDASHELKTPLTVILSNVQMLSDSGGDPQLRNKLTDNLVTVATQMKDLVENLLNSAKVDHGIDTRLFIPLDLSEMVSQALLPFDCVFYEREMKLTADIRDGIWVKGSRSHLTQVVDILLDNAQKYGVQQGAVHVSLARSCGTSCLLSVSNEGPPMSPKELKDVFRRFYRADTARERSGSYGLGLSIAEGIVRAHRGKIWAESRGGVNTFFVHLPAVAKKSRKPRIN